VNKLKITTLARYAFAVAAIMLKTIYPAPASAQSAGEKFQAIYKDGALSIVPKALLTDIPYNLSSNGAIDSVHPSAPGKVQTIYGLIDLSKGSAVRLISKDGDLFIWNYYSTADCYVRLSNTLLNVKSGHVLLLSQKQSSLAELLMAEGVHCWNIETTDLGQALRATNAEFDTSDHPLIVSDDDSPEMGKVLKGMEVQQRQREADWKLPPGRKPYQITPLPKPKAP
jgi:hypothetical protein